MNTTERLVRMALFIVAVAGSIILFLVFSMAEYLKKWDEWDRRHKVRGMTDEADRILRAEEEIKRIIN